MKPRWARLVSLWRFPGWFPEIASFGSKRIRDQVRLLGLAGVVGIVAGIGAIAFYIATRLVEHYALGALAGYYAEPHPGGEPSFSWLVVWRPSALPVAPAVDTDARRAH